MKKSKKKKETEEITTGKKSPGIYQHEDAVLKTAMQFFADELLPYFGIEGKVISLHRQNWWNSNYTNCLKILTLLWKTEVGIILNSRVQMTGLKI